MPLTEIHFELDGDTQYARAFQAFGREADDLSEPFHEIGAQIRVDVGEQFLTEGGHSGKPWPRLNAAYAAWKAEQVGPAQPILVFTGDMRAAALSEDAIMVTPHRLRYEIDDDKAIWHQRGDGHLPQRKMLDLPARSRRQWDRIIATWLNDIRRHAFAGRRA